MSRDKHCKTNKTIHHCIHLIVSSETIAINNSTVSCEIAVINLMYLLSYFIQVYVVSLTG